MNRLCETTGCGRGAATEYGIYCSKHSTNKRRNGHPQQEGITKGNLKPFLKRVEKRKVKNLESTAWATMEARWCALVESLRPLAESSHPTNKHARRAARELVKLGIHVPAQEIVDTVLAMYLMQEYEPRRFRSDEAFDCQLVRRIRGLTTLSRGAWTNPNTGKVHTATLELEPRTAEAMAMYVKQALGGAGVRLAALERNDEERKRKEAMEYHEQLRGLK